MPERTEITFVVDTDEYAGNFGREMAVFVTGVPYDMDGQFGESPYFKDLIECRHIDEDDYDHHAVYTTVPTPGWTNDGMGKETRLRPGEVMKHPAHHSVGIFLSRRPTSEEVALLKKRATDFCYTQKDCMNKRYTFRIEGFRFITKKITTIETDEPIAATTPML